MESKFSKKTLGKWVLHSNILLNACSTLSGTREQCMKMRRMYFKTTHNL